MKNENNEFLMEHIPDIRAEMLALELTIAGELDPETAVFLSKGLLRRAVTQDVETLEATCLPGESSPVWQFSLNREGFYETLPEAFLHARREREHDDTPADIVLHFGQLEQEKADARTFFLPFEQSFYRLRMELEHWESANYIGWLGGGKGTALAEFWELPGWLTERQALLACYVLPYLHRITGHIPLTAAVLEVMLGGRAEISYTDPAPASTGLSLASLGAMYLGADAILGDRVEEGLPGLRLRLSDWPAQRLVGYFRGSNDARLIEWLCTWLFPAGLDVVVEIEIRAEDRCFSFDADSGHSLLGYTTTF